MSALERNSQVPAPTPHKVLSQRDTAATAREESTLAGPHSRRGKTPLGRLQKYPKIHVSTGEESSGSGTESTQGLRPRHRRERNPERPPSNSHGDWPFLRPPERVPGIPIVSGEHLPQLGKIQEVLPSRRDEAHLRRGISSLHSVLDFLPDTASPLPLLLRALVCSLRALAALPWSLDLFSLF